jgi:chromosomal replication initiator protein DnaA
MTSLEIFYEDVWKKTKQLIENSNKYDSVVYNTYFENTRLVDLTDTKAIIVTKQKFNILLLNQEKDFIASKLSEVIDRSVFCSFVPESSYLEEIELSSAGDSSPIYDNILPNFNFENFVVGDSNKEAHSAALACSYNPGNFYNPLFIYGDSGLGKTHLMYAIGNYIKKNHPDKYILYIPASELIDKFTSASKNRNIDDLKLQFTNIDVLLVDDIQYLAKKEKTNEFFFQIYNSLVNNRKQIVLTSDKPPLELDGIEERLISRFSSGLSVTINSPEFETRLEILKMKLNTQNNDTSSLCDEESLSYIATNCTGDVRALEGMLNRLMYYSINFGDGKNITYDLTVEALKDVIVNSNINKSNISPSFIINTVSAYYGLSKQQVMTKSRTKNIINARHISMFLCRKHLDMSYKRIADIFNKCDHSTVISACEKIEGFIKENSQYQIAIAEIEKKLS